MPKQLLITVALLGCALASPHILAASPPTGPAMELAGVKIEETQTLQDKRLQLNGAGIRYKAVFKVYTAALYLEKKANSTDDVLQAPGYKRLSVTMLRDIEAEELGRLFTKGVESNVPSNELSRMLPHLVRMGQIFSAQKKLLSGDSFVLDWLPGTGTVLSVRGVAQGEPFKDPAFFNGMMRIWLGKSPADERLKAALLGLPSPLMASER